jgi:hypothetical protein
MRIRRSSLYSALSISMNFASLGNSGSGAVGAGRLAAALARSMMILSAMVDSITFMALSEILARLSEDRGHSSSGSLCRSYSDAKLHEMSPEFCVGAATRGDATSRCGDDASSRVEEHRRKVEAK